MLEHTAEECKDYVCPAVEEDQGADDVETLYSSAPGSFYTEGKKETNEAKKRKQST